MKKTNLFQRFFKFTSIFLILFFISSGIVIPKKVEAGSTTVFDPANFGATVTGWTKDAIWWMADRAKEIWEAVKEKWAWTTYRTILSNALSQMAYEYATYLGEGGEGKKPMFLTDERGQYFQNLADNAAGTFIEEVSQGAFGDSFNLCEPDLNAKILIGLGLTPPELDSNTCTFTSMLDNWEQEIAENKEFLSDFQNYFSAGGDLGVAVSLNDQKLAEMRATEDLATLDLIISKGYSDPTSPISNKSLAPAGTTEAELEANRARLNANLTNSTRDALVDAAKVFGNQYFITLFNRKIRELGRDAPETSRPYAGDYGGLTNPESEEVSNDSNFLTESLSELLIPNFETFSDLNLLTDLTTCPDPSNAGVKDCVINQNFSTAISSNLTVGQAMKKEYLRADGRFGFIVDSIDGQYSCYGEEPGYEDAYPYRSMLILRKYRVLPVGWELAAQYIHDNPAQTRNCNLGDMVACYDLSDEYVYQSETCQQGAWCRGLVDPNWVLTIPQHVCRREGPGPNIMYYQNVKTNDVDAEFVVKRDDYCADEQSCIYEKADGVCEQYGYCVEEKRKWNFGTDACDPNYNSCETFRSDEGGTKSFMENTLDNSTCNSDNVGCAAYCEDYDLDASAIPMFTMEQEGNTHFLPATFATPETAENFYNYTSASFNQPALYPLLEEDKSVLFVHYDTNNNRFSLGIFHDYPNTLLYPNCDALANCDTLSANCDCNGGGVQFTFEYISAGNSVAVADDPSEGGSLPEGSEVPNGATWSWNWSPCCTDGGMIDMPEGNWSVTINPNSSFVGLNKWVMAYDGGEINLSLDSPVTISKNIMSGNFACLAGNGDDIYLDRDVEECDKENEGCHEFIRTKTDLGTNVIQNSSFEDNEVATAVSVPASDYGMVGDSSIAWPIYGGLGGTEVSVYGVSAGRVHSGQKTLLIESDDAGIYSFTQETASVPSVFPLDFAFETNKAYTLSAWVWVESGEVEMGLGNDTVSWETVTSTETDKWERLVLTIVNEAAINANEFYIFANDPGTRFWVDDIQLETSLDVTPYKEYRNRNVVYEKILPDYLAEECYRIPGVDYRFKDDYPAICNDYARLCNQDEVGCELYTSLNSDVSIPANVDILDYCTEECVGYDEYLQLESPFSSLVPQHFIPETADVCNAGSVGCEEFTNLDEVAGGGEQREYYSYLRQCIKPDDADADCREFYTWEGSSETGFQLNVHLLQADDDSDDASYPNSEAMYLNDPAVTSYDYDECNSLIYEMNLNSDCREFYNRSGEISYHLYSKTLTCSDNCHPYRMTKNNIVKDPVTGANVSWVDCQAISNFSDYRDIITSSEYTARGGECVFCINGGVWDADIDSCVYEAIPEEGKSCSAEFSGCREYSGNDGNVVYNILNDNFEGDVQNWEGIGGTTLVTDNDSLRVNEEALLVQNTPFTISKEIGDRVTQGRSYYLEFIAKSISASEFSSIYLTNGTDIAEFYTDPSMNLSVGGQYALYKLNLSILGHEVSDIENLVIQADGGFLIDDIKLIEITDRYYLIEDSWQTPDSCFEDVYGNPVGQLYNLGCDAYQDRAGKTHYLHNFPVLCQESAVGCEALIDTNNYNEYFEETFNASDESEEVVAADTMVYAVYDEEKACESSYKGCQLVGEPYDYGNFSLYRGIYLINDPNIYSQILCRYNEKGCEEWQSREGFSYFKDPGSQTCEYRLESDSGKASAICNNDSDCVSGYVCVSGFCTKKTREWNWYKTQVKRCDSDSDGTVGVVDNICLDPSDCGTSGLSCSSDVDCGNDYDVCLNGTCHYACVKDVNDYLCPTTDNSTIGYGGVGGRIKTPTVDANDNNWVGLCPTTEESCTEYIDPISNFSVNMLSNGGFSDLYSYDNNWRCSISGGACWSLPEPDQPCSSGDGVCLDNVWKESGSDYVQTVSLEKNYLYRLAGKNNNANSELTIECPVLYKFDPTVNDFGSAVNSLTIDLEDAGRMYSEIIYASSDMNCLVRMNNVSPGQADYAELKEVTVDYQLEEDLDKTTCNGIVNASEGCVLFNERKVESKSLSGIDYSSLSYSADRTFEGAPFNCEGQDCNANTILKVDPDRGCSQWLACTNKIEAGNGEEAVCESIGICDRLDRNGECARFVPAIDKNYVYDPDILGIYNTGDIHNLSGYVKVGYEGTKINEKTTGKSDDKLNFGSMQPYGGQTNIVNGNFEMSHENLCATPENPSNCPTGTDWPMSDVDVSIKASADYGDDDYADNWNCLPTQSFKCEVIDDLAENEDESDCFEEDRDGTCRLYAPSGKKYMKLMANNSGKSSLTSGAFSVTPDTDYILSFYISTKGLNNGRAQVTINSTDDYGNVSQAPLVQYFDNRLPWQRVLYPFTTGPDTYILSLRITTVELPQGSIYIDDFRLEETLQVRSIQPGVETENIYEAKECRLYPKDDSLACDYYEDGVRYKGWSGYCLEHDRYPGWESACLQWWSVPHSVDSVNSWCGDEIVGDEEDCECDRDSDGNEVYACDSRIPLFGTTRENSYLCDNCMWDGGWCGDNYIDTSPHQGRVEECDWNDLFPDDPNTGGQGGTKITCENLPSAWDWAGRTDLSSYRGSLFTDGNLGCFSHDVGANATSDNNDRCKFDTDYNEGNFLTYYNDSSPDPTSPGTSNIDFGCTTQLADIDTTDNYIPNTARDCINAGGEVVSAIIDQGGAAAVGLGGRVVIDSTTEETIVSDPDFGDTFCKFSGSWDGSLGANGICSSIGGWRAFTTGGVPWTSTIGCTAKISCSGPPCVHSQSRDSIPHPIFQNLEIDTAYVYNDSCDWDSFEGRCTSDKNLCYSTVTAVGCY